MPISPTSKPVIFITMGDPAGIGPEVIAGSMASTELKGLAIFTLIGDAAVIKEALSARGVREEKGAIEIVDPDPSFSAPGAGEPTAEGARKALMSIDLAINSVKERGGDARSAIVTAPVNKRAIAAIHPGFIGHTEYFQQAFSSGMVTMVLAGKNLCVVPVTRHIPLKDVPSALSIDLIVKTIGQVVASKKAICEKDAPRIGVTALNPHCGEGGEIGREEIDVIAPAVQKAKEIYPDITGPVSADTAFYDALNGRLDIVISMYHDQCLAPFKMIDFDNGVNMTLGLGCVRTSPDHGTAYGIAGKGAASCESMTRAVKMAVRALA